ncbi:hypothetical protein D918_07110 [Trichuris suis]|nr:hypothetical protein D918_07110 [Trichuris suis]
MPSVFSFEVNHRRRFVKMSSSENQRNNRSWTDMSYSSFCNELPEAVGYCSSPFASSASSAESTMDSEYRTSKEDPQCLNCRASLTGEEFITSCPKLVLKPSNDIDRLKGKGIAMKLSRDCIQDDRLVSEGSDMNEGEANEVSFANFCRKWKDVISTLYWENPRDSMKTLAQALLLIYCIAAASLLKAMIYFWFILVIYYELVITPFRREQKDCSERVKQRIFMDGISLSLNLHRNVEMVSDVIQLAWVSLVNLAMYGDIKTLAKFFFTLCICTYCGKFITVPWLASLDNMRLDRLNWQVAEGNL